MKYLLCGVAAIAVLSACDRTGTDEPAPVGKIELRKGDAAEAPDVIAAMALTNSGDGLFTYDSKEVDGDKATFTNLVSTAEEGGFSAESLVFEGLDMIDGKAAFAKMSLNDIKFTPEEDDTGAMGIGKVELLNPTPELAAWMASSLAEAEPAAFPSADQLGFDAWSISDIAAEFSDEDGDGDFKIASLEIRDLKDQKAALTKLSGLTFDFVDAEESVPVKMNLDSFAITNADVSFLEAIQQNMDDEDAMAQAVMDKMYDNPMEPGYDRVTMDNFTVDASGVSFAMPSLDAHVERNSKGQPVKFVTEPLTMKLDADADGGEGGAGLAQALSMVGYENIELKMASISTYEPETDTVDFKAKDNYFEIVDGAKFSFGGEVAGYSAYASQLGDAMDFEAMAEGQEPDPMAFQQALGALKVSSFELKIADDSLVDRVFNAVAAQQGQDPEAMRKQVAGMMAMAPMFAQQAGIDTAIASELGAAVASFIQEPKTLTISLDPETPLSAESLTAMEDPSMITKDYLGFSASNK